MLESVESLDARQTSRSWASASVTVTAPAQGVPPSSDRISRTAPTTMAASSRHVSTRRALVSRMRSPPPRPSPRVTPRQTASGVTSSKVQVLVAPPANAAIP